MRLLLLILFFCFNSFAQSGKIDANIKNLNNNQFKIDHQNKGSFSAKSKAADKLVKIGKVSANKLIAALEDPEKTIMAHWTLCHIYFKHVSFAGPKKVSMADGDVLKYYLGEEKGEGLIISEVEAAGKIYIEPKDLEKIKEYWNKKRN